MSTFPSLISTSHLSSALATPSNNITILDGSWHIPTGLARPKVLETNQGITNYETAHIPNAQFFDLDAVSDTLSSLPHMLPPTSHFASSVGKLGVGNDTHVVVYDTQGLFSAARVWWMFRIFGSSGLLRTQQNQRFGWRPQEMES
jgi:thiosulfate/3-mercaptopyruvate sulfurtransferase